MTERITLGYGIVRRNATNRGLPVIRVNECAQGKILLTTTYDYLLLLLLLLIIIITIIIITTMIIIPIVIMCVPKCIGIAGP